MNDLLLDFKNRLTADSLHENTVMQYIRSINKFFVAKNINQPSDITTKIIMEYCAELQKIKGQDTINTFISVLKLFVEYFKISNIEFPKMKESVVKKEKQPINEKTDLVEIINRIGEVCKFPLRVKTVICFLFYTGLRANEVATLTRDDLIGKKIIDVWIPKQNKSKRVTIIQPLRILLERYFSSEAEENNAFNMSRHMMWYYVNKVFVEILGRESGCPHTLRHSTVKHYHEQGLDIKDIQEIIGHANMEQTEHYLKMDEILLSKKVQDKIKGVNLGE